MKLDFLALPEDERRLYIEQAAVRRGLSPVILEKDFWVCWLLGILFEWTLLSRDALRRAEKQLRDAADGVRDEVGFLALHQAYADRFFPGTSVLHTRLRYVLFVPWLYAKLAQQRDRQRIAATVENQEINLARRLKNSGEFGVIGGRSLPDSTTQPPTMVYWSALSAWRILRPDASGTIPSRQTIHRILAKQSIRQQVHDDDKQLLVEDEPLFYSVPQPPPAWHDQEQRLDFQLTAGEQQFLRNCFLSVARPGSGGSSSLLARLVEQNSAVRRLVSSTSHRPSCWESSSNGTPSEGKPVGKDRRDCQ